MCCCCCCCCFSLLTRLMSSLKVLSLSSEMSWGGTGWTSGPWHLRPGEFWSLSRLSRSLLFLPPVPLCASLLVSIVDSRCCCLLRTREIISLQWLARATSSSSSILNYTHSTWPLTLWRDWIPEQMLLFTQWRSLEIKRWSSVVKGN